MENASRHIKVNKGGRPKKEIKRDQQLGVLCTLIERKVIENKACQVNLSVSEFLRDLGLDSQIVRRNKALPKEVLQLTGILNHIAANLNQIAHKRNMSDELNAIERAELNVLSKQIKELAQGIKSYIQ